MPAIVQEYGTATRVVATGLSVITSANSAIIGVLFHGSGTASCQFFHGVTASSSATGLIRAAMTVAGATVNLAQFIRVPAYCSGGMTFKLGATADPDVTLFWNPV